MKRSVLLVALPNPTMTDPCVAPPLGALYLAAAVKDLAEVKVLDLNTDRIPVQDWGTYDIIGVTVTSTNYYLYYALSRAIKKLYPKTLLIAGGPHITSRYQDVKHETPTDIVVVGEGELALRTVIQNAFLFDSMIPLNDNVAIRVPLIQDMDTIQLPRRESVDFSKYTRTIGGEPATNIITSRGCPGKCIFCNQQTWENKLRFFSADYVLKEVDDIETKTGIKRLLFLDDTLTANRKRLLQICKGLKERGTIWRGWTRSNLVDSEMLDTMVASGCQSVCFGVESGSQKVLDALCKGTTVVENTHAIQMAKQAGLNVRVSLMVGNPKETLQDVIKTEAFMEINRKYVDDYILSTFVPVVGSPSFERPEDFGIILDPREAQTNHYKNYFVVGYDEKTPIVMCYEDKSKEEIAEHRKHLEDFLRENIPRTPEEIVK